MEPGILAVRIGGLGNQLFILTAAYIAAKVNRLPLYIEDMVCENHQTVTEDYASTIFAFFGTRVNGHDFSYKRYEPDGFSSWSTDLSPGTAMASYFQYYPAIRPYEEEIRGLVLKGLASFREALRLRYTESYAFLHVRRGDYLKASHVHYIQPIEYFQRAVERLGAKRFLVFSDDLDWVQQQEYFCREQFTLVRGLNELETLSLMSLCTEGAICSNSTFSWWGAFLGAHSVRNQVIVPEDWINCSLFQTDTWPRHSSKPVPPLFPEEWSIM